MIITQRQMAKFSKCVYEINEGMENTTIWTVEIMQKIKFLNRIDKYERFGIFKSYHWKNSWSTFQFRSLYFVL